VKAEHDSRLGQWHVKLQQKYKNEHNDGMTYVRPFESLPLTQPMILDWACALEEGHVTIFTPPNIDSFNAVTHKAPILHPKRASAQLPLPSSAMPAIDVNSLTSVLLIHTLMSNLLI